MFNILVGATPYCSLRTIHECLWQGWTIYIYSSSSPHCFQVSLNSTLADSIFNISLADNWNRLLKDSPLLCSGLPMLLQICGSSDCLLITMILKSNLHVAFKVWADLCPTPSHALTLLLFKYELAHLRNSLHANINPLAHCFSWG